MKQNIFGVLLFSLIIGTAIFVSESFVTLPTPPAVYERPVYESRNSCSKRVYPSTANSFAKIKINQAVLNPRTNQLNTSLLVERQNSSTENFGVTYHFFVKEGAATRFLASETVGIKPSFDRENKAVHEIMSSYKWLDNLNSQNNLYLIAETSYSSFSHNNSIPRFDEVNATPVLLMKGKN